MREQTEGEQWVVKRAEEEEIAPGEPSQEGKREEEGEGAGEGREKREWQERKRRMSERWGRRSREGGKSEQRLRSVWMRRARRSAPAVGSALAAEEKEDGANCEAEVTEDALSSFVQGIQITPF